MGTEYPETPTFDMSLVDMISHAMQYNVYMTNSLEELANKTNIIAGDIAIVNNGINPKTYFWTGREWLPFVDPCNMAPKEEVGVVECPSCGAHQMQHIKGNQYKCAYCESTVFIHWR